MADFIEQLGLSYTVEGEGKPLVILHGWGCNKEMFQFLIDKYKEKYRVYAFDLPGFGASREPKKVIGTEAFCDILMEAFHLLKIEKPIMIGHSHGGRIIIRLSAEMDFDKVILMGSAGIVNKRPFSYYIKVYTYKVLKKIYYFYPVRKLFPGLLDRYRKNAGSEDYRNASPIMKGVLSKVVNEDLKAYLPGIKAPTLLIWGEEDTATPLSDGKLMEKMIPDAGLVVFEGASHYAFLEQKQRLLAVLDAFI